VRTSGAFSFALPGDNGDSVSMCLSLITTYMFYGLHFAYLIYTNGDGNYTLQMCTIRLGQFIVFLV
jgi:hypothetical protein